MPFEVFTRRSARIAKDPFITIQKRGTLSMNASAAAMIAGTEDPDGLAVELMFDPTDRAVGIRKATDDTNAYEMRKQKNSESYLLSGKAFTQHYGIQTGQARRYKALDFGNGVVGFQLDQPHQNVGRS